MSFGKTVLIFDCQDFFEQGKKDFDSAPIYDDYEEHEEFPAKEDLNVTPSVQANTVEDVPQVSRTKLFQEEESDTIRASDAELEADAELETEVTTELDTLIISEGRMTRSRTRKLAGAVRKLLNGVRNEDDEQLKHKLKHDDLEYELDKRRIELERRRTELELIAELEYVSMRKHVPEQEYVAGLKFIAELKENAELEELNKIGKLESVAELKYSTELEEHPRTVFDPGSISALHQQYDPSSSWVLGIIKTVVTIIMETPRAIQSIQTRI